jgi:hypothetical protein
VLWRREVAENNVEAESEEGSTYDLTFESSLRLFLVSELSKLSSRRKCQAVEFVEVELSVDRRIVS